MLKNYSGRVCRVGRGGFAPRTPSRSLATYATTKTTPSSPHLNHNINNSSSPFTSSPTPSASASARIGPLLGPISRRLTSSALASIHSSPLPLERHKSRARLVALDRRAKGDQEEGAVDSASSAPRQAREHSGDAADGGAPAGASGAAGAAAGAGAGAGDGGQSSQGGESGSGSSSDGGPTSISKRSVPDVYPQVLALPITRRPLFPGFYKAVVIRDQNVIAAIKEAIKRGQPYIGAFLLKDEEADSDVITDHNSVHPVGVFAQITSTFPAKSNDKNEPEGLTAVLYPHRRIRIDELLSIPTLKAAEATDAAEVDTKEPAPAATDAVASEPSTSTTPAESSPDELSPDAPTFQTQFLHNHAVSIVNVSNVEIDAHDAKSQVIRAMSAEIVSVFKDIAQLNPLFRDQIANFSMSQSAGNVFEEPAKLADFAAAVSTGEVDELQAVLESAVLEDRMQKALTVLKKELMNAQLQSKISKDVESKIQKRQREYYLMEQLKGIKKELGLESDGKDKLVDTFKTKADALLMPEAVRKVFDEELSKLQHLEPAASEFNVTRNYLDWLTQIPWGRHSVENFALDHATQVLDEDHYGLKDVKDRILEFLAVGKLRGTVEGKILCFVGPPGVGKTSIGKSIARALDREFFRFSVGGLSDVAEIKGHRRTYVGAMPGKIIQALKKVQTENPLVLIDEVDKIGRGHNGDPSSALLEMLDPEQNAQFLDHYLDVPVNLSRVLFVCTANSLSTIPAPLLDRMEVLEVSGYITEEKAAIASRYLGPQAKEGAGLKGADVELTEEAVATLIRYYCRESGVRRLKQQIEKVYRKAALKIVQDLGETDLKEDKAKAVEPKPEAEPTTTTPPPNAPEAAAPGPATAAEGATAEPAAASDATNKSTAVRQPLSVPDSVHVRIGSENLLEYVGPPNYQKDRLYTSTSPVGVSCGLGYLGNGSGATMPIECQSMPGSGIQLTGKLGEVIKESAQIALSFLRANAFTLGLTDDKDKDLIEKRAIHLHMPEGAIGKEGPSAGTAILTAFVSLFSKTGIRSDLAMTGEMTLAGQVLPVGGLKEKILAAHRAGIKKILAPAACRADIEHNVPESVKEGIEIVYVENVSQVIDHAFEGRFEWQKKLPFESWTKED